jgi:peptidyl-prolyl cis-trans isomerase A (cyclophilin A)
MLAFARFFLLSLGTLASFQLFAANPQVEFETSRGSFVIELYPDKAPRTVENFLQYVNNSFYSGTIFHRTIHRFVVQGGGLTETLEPKETRKPIPNESDNGLSNDYGTIAMARGYGSDSATSQFFVNLDDNRFLNYYRNEPGLQGYTVFGRVIRGMEVLLRISDGATALVGRLDHVPNEPAVIRSSRVLETTIIAENYPSAPTTLKAQEKTKPSTSKKGKKRG